MALDEKYDDLIERYLMGKLSGEEKLSFEREITQSKELEKEVKFQRAFMSGVAQVRKEELKLYLKQHSRTQAPSPARIYMRYAQFAIVLLLVIGFMFVLKNNFLDTEQAQNNQITPSKEPILTEKLSTTPQKEDKEAINPLPEKKQKDNPTPINSDKKTTKNVDKVVVAKKVKENNNLIVSQKSPEVVSMTEEAKDIVSTNSTEMDNNTGGGSTESTQSAPVVTQQGNRIKFQIDSIGGKEVVTNKASRKESKRAVSYGSPDGGAENKTRIKNKIIDFRESNYVIEIKSRTTNPTTYMFDGKKITIYFNEYVSTQKQFLYKNTVYIKLNNTFYSINKDIINSDLQPFNSILINEVPKEIREK